MPRILMDGGQLAPGSVGPRQVRGNPTTKAATPPIEVKKFCQNGDSPSAQYWNLLNEATNAAALYRAKQVFSCSTRIGLSAATVPSSTAGTRNRWRAAFHTGPYTTRVMARVVLCPPNNNFGNATYGKLTIFSGTTEGTTVGSASFYYGAGPGTTIVNGYQYLREIMLPIEGLTASTDYTLRFDDIDYGRIICASVFELPSLNDGITGSLPLTLNQDSEVLHIYRSNVATVQKNLWKRAGGTILTWTVDEQSSPRTNATSTATNLIDGSSTTYSASIPGFTFDMSNKARLSQTSGVPIKVRVYGSYSADSCYVTLRDSTGASVVEVTVNGAAAWYSNTGYLPASSGKYYLTHHADTGLGPNTVTTYAVSIFPYET